MVRIYEFIVRINVQREFVNHEQCTEIVNDIHTQLSWLHILVKEDRSSFYYNIQSFPSWRIDLLFTIWIPVKK